MYKIKKIYKRNIILINFKVLLIIVRSILFIFKSNNNFAISSQTIFLQTKFQQYNYIMIGL